MASLGSVDWFVIAAGAATVAWTLWYFFAERGSAAAVLSAGGRQEVTVTVQGGYTPAVIRVKAGAPLRLRFDRKETAGCSEEVVFNDFGIRKFLPAHQQTVVDLTPAKPGVYEFTCGMSMLRGKLVAE